jgi:hypothetical protein
MASHGAGVAISPFEMYRFVFALLEDEMSADPSYMVSVIIEFLRRYVSFICYSLLVLTPQMNYVPTTLHLGCYKFSSVLLFHIPELKSVPISFDLVLCHE